MTSAQRWTLRALMPQVCWRVRCGCSPALMASEKAMPSNYNASLRVAQMESNAKRYPDAIAACDRGLLHVTGPIGRAWLMQVKAEALQKMGNKKQARQGLQDALPVARQIG